MTLRSGRTALHALACIATDQPGLGRALLAAGAKPDELSPPDGETALYAACRSGHIGLIRVLLEAKADPKVTHSLRPA